MNRTFYLILPLLFISKASLGQPCVNGLQGTHTIGPTGQYPSLTVAFDSLRSKGVSGPVILELQSNYNSSTETFPIKFTKTPCTDSIWNIIIRPQAGATGLQISSNNPLTTIDFNNGKFITIDGRSGGTGITSALTISNSNTAGSTIRFINDASWNTIKFLDLQGVNPSHFNGVVYLAGTDSTTGNDFNTIDTCRVHNGATNPANLIYSNGTIFKYNTGLRIRGCDLYDFHSYNGASHGIYIASNNEKSLIIGNHIYQTSARTYLGNISFPFVYGIRVYTPSQGGHVIKDNFIGGTQRNAAGGKMRLIGAFSFRGIGVGNGSGSANACVVENNTVRNLSLRSEGGTGYINVMIELGFDFNSPDKFNGNCVGNTVGSMTTDSSIVYRNFLDEGIQGILYGINATDLSGNDSSNIRLNNIGGLYIDTATANNSSKCSLIGMQLQFENSLEPIRCLVEQNTIGNPAMPKSMFNGGKYFSIGMNVRGSSSGGNLLIRNNTICNITQGSTFLRQSSGWIWGIDIDGSMGGTFTVSKNKIFNLQQQNISSPYINCVTGIKLWQGSNNGPGIFNITENEIYNLYTDNVSSSMRLELIGIHVDQSTTGPTLPMFTTNITRNYIHSLSAKTGTLADAVSVSAIYLEQETNNANVENNMIRLGLDTAGNTINKAVLYKAINEQSGDTNRYLHNTILLTGYTNPNLDSYAFYSQAPAGTKRVIKNNIFGNLRGDQTDISPRNHCIHIVPGSGGTPLLDLDNNSYYFDKPSGRMGTIGGLGIGSPIATFSEWKAVTQKDSNSIFTNPNFVDSAGPASGRPIHIESPTAIEGRGSPAYTTYLDFDGDLRNNLSPVDIGADAGDFLQIEPGRAASNILTSNVASTSAIVSVTSGDGERRLFVVRRDNAVTNVPVDGVGYNPSNSFGAGSNLGNNTFVVADTGSTVTINNLMPGTTYHVRVFEFNGRNTSANYLTTNAATTSFTTQSVTAVIDLQSTEYSASVFPNPGETFWISIRSRRTTTAQVSVYSLSGELLFTENIPMNSGNNVWELEKIKKYPSGVYILKMNIGKSKGTAKLVKF